VLRIPLDEYQKLQTFAFEREFETCAVGLVYPVGSRGDFVVRQLSEVPAEAYVRRTSVAAELSPAYCMAISNRARQAGVGALFAHTHIGKRTLEGFSHQDDAGEQPLAEYFARRSPNARHFASVFTASGSYARELGKSLLVPVRAIGRTLDSSNPDANAIDDRYDRQVRALGARGQRILQQLVVAIVGLGGTGSVVAQQLAHLGVGSFVLIDPDTVEPTNLNRLVGATPSDVGKPKTSIAARHISHINPSARTQESVADVVDSSVAKMLEDVDFIFGCTDSMASRAVLNQLAYQFLVPYVDVGVGIFVSDSNVEYVTGRVQMLSPGLPCMVCTEKLDAEQVRRELLTEDQRKQDPYITGAVVLQPAVISLNSLVSSAAVSMFLAATTGFPSEARMLVYDGIRGSLRPAVTEPSPRCIVCSYDGALARGGTWDLPRRA
jgi:molybdopterin/thiamine biosynthesis adenylyltransferase